MSKIYTFSEEGPNELLGLAMGASVSFAYSSGKHQNARQMHFEPKVHGGQIEVKARIRYS